MTWIANLAKKQGFIPPYMPAEVKLDVQRPCISFFPYNEVSRRNERKRIYIPAKTNNKAKWVQDLMEDIESRLKGGYYLPAVKGREIYISLGTHGEKPDMLATEAVTAYLEHKLPLVSSQRDYISIFENTFREYLVAFWPDLKLNEFSKSHIARFLNDKQQEKTWSPKTRNNYRHALYNFFSYFIELEVLEANPADRVTLQKNKNANHYMPFMDEQVDELQPYFAKSNPLLHQLTRFVYYTFARPWKELRLARVMHLDMKNQTMFIPSAHSKNGQGDYVFLPDKLCELIDLYKLDKSPPSAFLLSDNGIPSYKPMVVTTIREQHRKILSRFGLKETHHLYSWKPTGVCAMYRACKDIKAVQKQCRHSDISMTDTYLSKLGLYQDLFRVNFE